MEKTDIIRWLSQLPIDELGDILIQVGAFRNAQVDKEDLENWMGCDLYYDEYKNVDEVDVFVFPRNTEEQEEE